MFWSDLGPKIGFEAIGLVDSSLQTVGLFAKADEDDTPAALPNENNVLRSDLTEQKVFEIVKLLNFILYLILIKKTDGAVKVESGLRKPFSSDEFGKGVILYLKNDVLVGVLCWNVFTKIPIARQVNFIFLKKAS
jgi:apoptosis-inducing factor 1